MCAWGERKRERGVGKIVCVRGEREGRGQRESETERRKRGKKETEGVGSGESDRASE